MRTFTVDRVTSRNLRDTIRANVDRSTRIMTDEAKVYIGIGQHFASHETVKHVDHEYVRGDVTTNTVEGFFALLKRGVYGTYHHWSKQHVHRYVAEFEHRYNTRKMTDAERVTTVIRGAEGKRLTYRPLTESDERPLSCTATAASRAVAAMGYSECGTRVGIGSSSSGFSISRSSSTTTAATRL